MAGAVHVENERYRIEFNEPGVHPFMRVLLRGEGPSWEPALILGARQYRYAHRGSPFPRIFCPHEEDCGAEFEFRTSHDGLGGFTAGDYRGNFGVTSDLTVDETNSFIHVSHELTASNRVKLNRVFDRYDFVAASGGRPGEKVDYSFVPHLRPRENMVISDQVFRSPAVMVKSADVFFALVPDLRVMDECYRDVGVRYYLDYTAAGGENGSPSVCFGIGRSRPAGHVYFESCFGRPFDIPEGRVLRLAYYLLLGEGGLDRSDVLRFLWERFGSGNLLRKSPQTVSFDRYAMAGMERIFKRRDLFRKFELEGQPCGGTIAWHLATRKGVRLMNRRELDRYLRVQDLLLNIQRHGLERLTRSPRGTRLLEKAIYRHGPKVPPQVLFQSWFNNLRSAYGAYWFARKWGDDELFERALAVKNLAILAPREEGAFPSVCYPTDEGIFWSRGTRAFKHIDSYHTADCSTTAYYMTLWFRDHEGDPRLLMRCREYASFLERIQAPSGSFPAWVKPAGPALDISPELRESATTASGAMFLASLSIVGGDERSLESAARAARFLSEEVIPEQKWFDYETFFSCSSKRLGLFDHYTGTFPQNTLGMYWAAEAFRLLYLATKDEDYLEQGRRVLDHLCLYQQVWDPPFLAIDAFGGFGVMNTDGEWNDSRQALFAPLLMDYYDSTGLAEYMERGIAALRASFTTMYLEENRRVAPGNMRYFHHQETGSVAENYGHFGYDHPTPGYLESDWGAGSACQAAAYAQRHYGDIYLDVERERAFGIDGCRIAGFELRGGRAHLDVQMLIEPGLEAVIRVRGAPRSFDLVVNGSPAAKTGDTEYRVAL